MNWNSDSSLSGLVPVNGANLHLSVRGPTRTPGQPVVICEAGHGASGAYWLGVQRSASEFIRVYVYDRAGYGRSTPGHNPRSAAALAEELSTLLDSVSVPGPYVVLCHSWGGVIAREFQARRDSDVAGIIFVDVITERMFEGAVPPLPEYFDVAGDFDSHETIGTDKSHKLSPEDWRQVMYIGPHTGATWALERESLKQSAADLAAKDQLSTQAMGSRPVVVVKGNATKDIKLISEAGIAAGNGTPAQRQTLIQWMENSEATREAHQRELLQLSSCSRFVVAENSGHSIQLTEPELIVMEIKMMLAQINESQANN